MRVELDSVKHRLRVYADTSVFGGCLDEEFKSASLKFFAEVRSGRFCVVVSPTTLRELARAPVAIRTVLAELPRDVVDVVTHSAEAEALRDAYISAGVLGMASQADAEHIAYASVSEVDIIISWNFKHIVNFDKIRGFHAINMLRGYAFVPIHSPPEVIET
ncbi:MAG: hypothetical protein FLDDKLPJ_01306 [Phycisphaerae bacterium]|nr:hypothetical protein [Phycisphaerae bacterium]